MIAKNEELCAEFAARLNDMEGEIKSILGEDTVKINNNKEMPGCIDIWFNGKYVYDPADQSEAEAYLSGIIDTYKLIKSKSNNQKVFVLVNTYFRADVIGGNSDPIINGIYDNYENAKQAMDEEKKKIIAEDYDENKYKIDEDGTFRWTIQQDDWDDWDSLYIEEVVKTGKEKKSYLVVETASSETENETKPKFLCVTDDKKIAVEAFKKTVEDAKYFFDEKFNISEDTDTEFQINSEVYDTWKKISLI